MLYDNDIAYRRGRGEKHIQYNIYFTIKTKTMEKSHRNVQLQQQRYYFLYKVCPVSTFVFSLYLIIIFLLIVYPLYPILVFFFSRTCFVCVRFRIHFIQGKHHTCNGKAGKSLHEIIESVRKYISVIFMLFFSSYLPIFHRSCSQG